MGWPEVETIPKMSFHTHPEAEKLTPSYADILVLLLSPSSVSIISNNKDYYVMSREENCLSMYIDINRELDSSARGKKFSEKKRIIYSLNEIYDRRTGRKSLYGFDNRSFYKDIKKTLLGYGISVVEYIKNESGDIVLVVQGSGAGGQGAGRP